MPSMWQRMQPIPCLARGPQLMDQAHLWVFTLQDTLLWPGHYHWASESSPAWGKEGKHQWSFNHNFPGEMATWSHLWWQMEEYQWRSRHFHFSQQTKHLLASRLENNITSAEDMFPLTAKSCPEMSHTATFQSNLPHFHQGICGQKGFIYIFCYFFPSLESIQILMVK